MQKPGLCSRAHLKSRRENVAFGQMIVTSAIAGKFDAIAVIALVDYRNSGGPFGADGQQGNDSGPELAVLYDFDDIAFAEPAFFWADPGKRRVFRKADTVETPMAVIDPLLTEPQLRLYGVEKPRFYGEMVGTGIGLAAHAGFGPFKRRKETDGLTAGLHRVFRPVSVNFSHLQLKDSRGGRFFADHRF